MKKLLLLFIVLACNYSCKQGISEEYKVAVRNAKNINSTPSEKHKKTLISLESYAEEKDFNPYDTTSYIQWYCAPHSTDTMIYVTTFQKDTDYYNVKVDTTINTNQYVLWITLPNELNRKLEREFAGMELKDSVNMRKRLAQILGMPTPETEALLESRIITIKVSKNRLLRPAFNPNPNLTTSTYFVDNTYASQANWDNYRDWFNNTCRNTYPKDDKEEVTNNHYPFTGLGYTYDWGSLTSDYYGLSEFIIIPQSDVTIVNNLPVWKYYEELKKALY